ncbi:MAG: S41 family peptidase [Acidobacteriota bacterium]|nr:S41 family peptidase [Acidobacteriota bacterium]
MFKFTINLILLIGFVFFGLSPAASAQKFEGLQREAAKDMLKSVRNEIKKNYYDPSFGGKDVEAIFKDAEKQIEQATSMSQAVAVIAQAVLDLNDSHTIFYPPSRTSKVEYGWQMQMIGDRCFVVAVKPGSDAEAKGLRPGDEIVTVDGFRPKRSDLWIMQYFYYTLSPRSGIRLVVKSPNAPEKPYQLDISAQIKQLNRFVDLTSPDAIYDLIREAENEERYYAHRFKKVDDVVIWSMPTFAFEPERVDSLVNDHVKDGRSLVLDLRGNPGGYVTTLEKLAGYFFDHDVKIADLKGRREMKPQVAESRGAKAFQGKVVVLIDSESGSAAEIFARLMQIEKRGIVVGDKSAGAVMRSRSYGQKTGVNSVMLYGVSVTDADVIMSDGKSLEKVGVIPDELMLPTAADMAAGRDAVLARAVELAGGKITPEQAGKFFPVQWRK